MECKNRRVEDYQLFYERKETKKRDEKNDDET